MQIYNCGLTKNQNSPTLVINGVSEWWNPYGQLTGDMLGYLFVSLVISGIQFL